MLRFSRVFAFTVFLCGCTSTNEGVQGTATVPATDATSQMVGKWGIEGEVALIVSQAGDRIIFAAPENDTWRMVISEAEVEGESVSFVQRNFLHSGEEHPFNGVACDTEVRLVDFDTMEMSMTTVHTPDVESDLLSRIE